MKERLYIIGLTDALKSGDGCLFCYIERNLEQSAIKFMLGFSYIKGDIQDKTDRQGFYKIHTKNTFDHGSSLRNARVLKSRLKYLRRGLGTQMGDYTPGKAAPVWRRKKSDKEMPGPGNWIREEGSHCYVYGRIRETYGRVLDTFVHMLHHEKDFMDMMGQSRGFYIHHFADLCDVYERSLNQKEEEQLFPVLFAQTEKELIRMQEDIDRFIEKYDYRNTDADWKTSKDAVQRTMQKTVNGYPTGPVFKNRKQELDKMIWMLVVVCGLLLLIYIRSEYEKKHFSVDTYGICSGKIHEEEGAFVFLSGLHDNRFSAGQKDLLGAITEVKPDGVILGGDMMITDGSKDYVDTEQALYLVWQLAGKCPVYYGFGNRESRTNQSKRQFGSVYEEYCKKLCQAGVHIVKGRERYEIGGDIIVAGMELPRECYRKFSPERLDARLLSIQMGKTEEKRYQILLTHTPIMFKQYQTWKTNLTLSGYFHGGTIRLPLLGDLMTPQFQSFYHYYGGRFEKNGHTLIVSRDLGTRSVNIRLNNQSQLVMVKLKGRMGQREALTETAVS